MPNLIEDFFNPEFYDATIEHVCLKDIPRATLRKFCTVDFQLQLLQDLADSKYAISPPRIGYIPKEDGTLREIYINTVKDRFILANVNNIWYARHRDMISSACKAYMPGASCAKAVREAVKHVTHGYKLDLSKYFDSVPHEVINKYLKLLDTGTPLDAAIYRYYNDDHVYLKKSLTDRFKSLAQGCAVSAFLSNCVLKDIDDKMLQMCSYYCRYSDDMLLLGDRADEALAELKRMLSKIGLSLNPKKIEAIIPDREFKFLGFGVCGSTIRISEKDFNNKKECIRKATKRVCHNKYLTPQQKLKKATRATLAEFICWSEPAYSWIYSKAQAVTDTARLIELDRFCKEHIRAAVTGKWNYTTNKNKITDDMLRDAGYISLIQMFDLAKLDRTLFEQECLQWRQHLS